MSTKEQLKRDSLRRQLEQSRRFADERGLALVEDYEDIGVSAYTGDNVTSGALGRFLRAVRDQKIERGSFLIVESLDRLSRQKLLESLSVFLDIVSSGINLVTLTDRREYSSGTTDLHDLLYSLAIMSRAHEESRTKSFRVLEAWDQKRKQIAQRKLTAKCPGWLTISNDGKSFQVIPDRKKSFNGFTRRAAPASVITL